MKTEMHPGNARKDQKWMVWSIPEVEGGGGLKKRKNIWVTISDMQSLL